MLTRRASWSWAWCLGAVLTLGACTHTPPIVVPPVLVCPAGQHAVDGVCVPDVVPPPAEEMPAARLLLKAEGPNLFYADGVPFEFRQRVDCCEATKGTGWPGVSRRSIDEGLRLGRVTLVHQRVGPFLAGNEPGEYPQGGAYVEAGGGKVDLDRWSEPYWTEQTEILRYAGLRGVVVERVVVDDWGITQGAWASGDGPAAAYPWAPAGNVQGEAAHQPGTVSPREEAFIRKAVSTSCRFGNVVYQLGQEERNVPGYSYAGVTKRRAEIVRAEEARQGCPQHLLSQSSERDESFNAPETQWTILHGYLPGEPFEGKVTSNNEGFNGDGTTCGEVAAAWCYAESRGSHVAIWRGTMDSDNFTCAQGRMSEGLASCAPHELAGCSIEPRTVDQVRCGVFSNALHDCTPKIAGQDVQVEGRTDRARCELLAMGGIPSFSLANVTGTLSIRQRPGNALQFEASGTGEGDLVCTIPARGAENVCRGKDGRPFRVVR